MEKQESEKLRQRADQLRYVVQINLIDRIRQQGKRRLALQLLEQLRPGPGQEDLRGFEWYHLWQECSGHDWEHGGHGPPVNSLTFSDNGRWLVSVSVDGAILVWDWASKRQIHRFQGKASETIDSFFCPRNRFLTISFGHNGIFVWDLETGKEQSPDSPMAHWLIVLEVWPSVRLAVGFGR